MQAIDFSHNSLYTNNITVGFLHQTVIARYVRKMQGSLGLCIEKAFDITVLSTHS